MTVRLRALLAVAMLVMLWGVAPAVAPRASAETRTVSVVVFPLTPFVMKSTDNKWTGFTIELWEQIAERLDWKTNYVAADGVAGQLKAIADGKADIAASALSITAEREKQFDFSQPILNGGLQIMVPRGHHGESSGPGLQAFLDLLFSKMMLVWLSAAAVVALVPAHIMWFSERRHKDSMISRSYFPGIFPSFAWGFGALAAVAPLEPQRWPGRVLAVLWGCVGIIFAAFYTANLTATLTVEQIEGHINGPDDLYGKKVAAVAHTTSAQYLKSIAVPITEMTTIDDCYQALKNGYDAVVFDAPVLRYYAAHDGAGMVQMVGAPFHEEDYGLLFKFRSELRKPVDGALLSIREDGSFEALENKWFGVAEPNG